MSTATATAEKPTTPATNGPDQAAIDAVNLSRMKAAQEEFHSAQGSLRSIFGKAELQGIHMKAAKRALAIVKAGNVEDWLAEQGKVTSYLKILRHGVTESQLTLDLESTLAPIEERASLDGRSAGLSGAEESTNPHHGNTKAGQAWLSAYHQGFAERELVLSMKIENDEDGLPVMEDDEE